MKKKKIRKFPIKSKSKKKRIEPESQKEDPLVFFPAGESIADCQDFQTQGFNTFGFLGFMLGVANIVVQVYIVKVHSVTGKVKIVSQSSSILI